jgi:hypothetical protein
MPDIVIFRADRKDGIVTAVFPEWPADVAGRFMVCYAHIGQHGSCSCSWYDTTRRAKPHEYAALLTELASIGYELIVRRRLTWRMQTRREENA